MAGIKSARKIQIGKEANSGVEVNATATWRGTGTPLGDDMIAFPAEDVGYISGVDRAYIPSVLARLVLDPTPATFEQLPYLLEMGVKAVATGTADGNGSSGYKYDYTFPTTSKNTINTYTVEAGDDQQEEQFLYGYCESFALAGQAREAVMMSGQLAGRQLAPGTYTSLASLPTVEEILFQKAKLYLDAFNGTIGTTQKTQTLLQFDFRVKTGWIPVYTGDGNLYFTFAKLTMPEVTLAVTFEHDGTATAEKAFWRANTARLLRLEMLGAALGTAGTGTTFAGFKGLRIDLAGKWEQFDKIGERDGNDIVVGHFRARYNATAQKFAEILIVNELSALT